MISRDDICQNLYLPSVRQTVCAVGRGHNRCYPLRIWGEDVSAWCYSVSLEMNLIDSQYQPQPPNQTHPSCYICQIRQNNRRMYTQRI